jgi:hypothetical protein
MGQLRKLAFAMLLGCLTAPLPVSATVIFHFEGQPTRGLYSMSAEMGFRDAVLEREGDIPFEDLEWVRTTYQYSISEFDLSAPAGPGSRRLAMGNGTELPFVPSAIVTDTGGTIVRWGDVRIVGDELVFGGSPQEPRGTSIAAFAFCEGNDQGEVLFCYPLDIYSLSTSEGTTRLGLFQDEDECGQNFSRCEAVGTFQLVETQVPEPAPMTLLVTSLFVGGWLRLRRQRTATASRPVHAHGPCTALYQRAVPLHQRTVKTLRGCS